MSDKRIYSIDVNSRVGESVTLKGWVNIIRDMGKIIFYDLRDREGIVQIVLTPFDLSEDEYSLAKEVRPEWIVEIEGVVQERGEKNKNPNIPTGNVEILAKRLKVLSKAQTPPFEVSEDTSKVHEETRLKYRYLDLRTERMKSNIILRHNVIRLAREYMYDRGFLEIETPFLTRSTPEGARDFLVPSRNYKGKFYALPQSPQQYKQLLMVAGMEKYFQIVRCFRDEDQRGDRQAEFTQLDIEASFISQEEIMQVVEELVKYIVKELGSRFGRNYKMTFDSFPRLTFDDVMKEYKTDRPDLRKNKEDQEELAFAWVVDFPMFEYKEGDGRWGATHHPFTAIKDEDVEKIFTENPDLGSIKAKQYDLVLNGNEIAGGSIRTSDPEILQRVFEILQHGKEEIEEKFGHLLRAFSYGVPPHGGIAFGLDRFLMVLAGERSIREVIAFPKTSDNRDPLMNSPSDVSQEQLDELGIEVKGEK